MRKRTITATLLLLAMASPAVAQVPVIDGANLDQNTLIDRTTSQIEEVDQERYTVSASVTCSMFRAARESDPNAAIAANPEIAGLVRRVAREEGVDERQFLALVYQESRFNPCAQSGAGAYGLAQLMPGTAGDLGVNPHNIEENLRGGARYYKQQLRKYDGNIQLALAAYNAGPGNVDKYGGIPPFAETQDYVEKITQRWLPALGGTDLSSLPMNYGGSTTGYAGMRDSTVNAMATNQAISASSGNVASWLQQLGGVSTGTIQDSWDHNSSARNANLEMMNQAIRLGTTMADLFNSRNALSAGELSSSSQTINVSNGNSQDRDTIALCAGLENHTWDEEQDACVATHEDPNQVQLMLQPQ